MLSTETEFLAPSSLKEALKAIGKEDAIFLGGGTSTALMYKTRLIEPSRVVWLGSIKDLVGITLTDNTIHIGAMTSMAQITASKELQHEARGVADAAGIIGNARVRAMATLGGALAHADPRQDVPPALIAVGAQVTLKSSSNERTVKLTDFYRGFLETVLLPDELITEVMIPRDPKRKCAYIRYTPTSEGDYPTVGVSAAVTFDNDRKTILGATVALCGVGQVPIIINEATGILSETTGSDELLRKVAKVARESVNPSDDERGSAAYKKDMSEVFTFRALKKCLQIN